MKILVHFSGVPVELETNGFSVYKDKKKLDFIKRLANERGIIVITDSACKSSVCVYNMRPSKLSNSIRTELSFDFGSSTDKRSATGLGYKRNLKKSFAPSGKPVIGVKVNVFISDKTIGCTLPSFEFTLS